MTPDQWAELERLFHEVRNRSPDDTETFLTVACPDVEVRAELRSLLSAELDNSSLLDRPGLQKPTHSVPNQCASLVGERVDRYAVVERVGSGGMGEVYRARDTQLKRDVALKFLFASSDDDALLLREAQSAAGLAHPSICTVHEVASFRNRPYIVMEYVDGETLADLLRRSPLPLDCVVDYASQIAAAVAHAHARQLLHKDLKASNVLVGQDGRIKVVDFGIARRLDSSGVELQTQSSLGPRCLAGTPAYMAPEVLRGRPADVRSDVWSIGVLVHEMACGFPPFTADATVDVIANVMRGDPLGLEVAVPLPLQPLIRRCLRLDPAERFQSVQELCCALDKIADDCASPIGAGPPARTPVFHRRWSLLLAAVPLALLPLVFSGRLSSPDLAIPHDRSVERPPTTLAVLPLELDGETRDMGVGIADSIITRLVGLPGLEVKATAAVRHLDAMSALSGKARSLNVDYILCGRAAVHGDDYVVTLQLVHSRDNTVAWGHPFTIPRTHVANLDRLISEHVADALQVPLTEDVRARLVRPDTSNTQARQHYLAGRAIMTREELPDSWLHEFEQAIRLDPRYARAWAGLAQAFARKYWHPETREKSARYRARAIHAAEQALALDPALAETHEALSTVFRYSEHEWEKTIEEARKALNLDPALELPHHNMATAFYHLGLFELSESESRAGMRANVESRYDAALSRARSALYAGNYSSAEQLAMEEGRSVGPGRMWILAESRFHLGREGESERDFRSILSNPKAGVIGNRARASLATILAAAGKSQEAQSLLGPLITNPPNDHHVTYRIATALAQLHRADDSVRWLRHSAETGFPCYPLFARDPLLAPVRDTLAFQDLSRTLRAEWQMRRARYTPAQRVF
jgi:serine/threonine protein kinase